MKRVRLQEPFTPSKLAALKVGDLVEFSGRVLTGRDRFHRYLAEGGRPPVSLKQAALYHCGPVVVQEGHGWAIRAAGPTTSHRMEGFMPRILDRHPLAVIIGKGGMGEATRLALQHHGAVYLHAVGGTAALLARCVRKVIGVYFLDAFGPAEAVWELGVEGLEAVVTIDARGQSLHRRIQAESRRALAELLR